MQGRPDGRGQGSGAQLGSDVAREKTEVAAEGSSTESGRA